MDDSGFLCLDKQRTYEWKENDTIYTLKIYLY